MDTDVAPQRDDRAGEVPVQAGDSEYLGPYDRSGFRDPRYLVRRADGQVVQLPQVLYLLARHADGRHTLGDLAALVRDETGREITADQAGHLIDDRLRPAGLATLPTEGRGAATPVPSGQAPRGDHLLMFRLRTALIPEDVVQRLAGPLRPLFHPPAVLVVLAAFLVVDTAIVVLHGWDALLHAGRALTETPALTLAVLGGIVVAGLFHEIGHVTACRYGGARPGSMGVGIYLVWPAFYSTVTDAYRLSRGGRLRTDLGGVYFNAVLLTVVGAGYLATGSPWLLAFAAFWHLETVWQFLPSLRLDGYYVLADLVGVPDLFNRIRPVLRGVVRRRVDDPLVADLKPWVRRVVIGWVVLVVPFLLSWVVLFAVLAPQLAPATWASLTRFVDRGVTAIAQGRVVEAVATVASTALLVLPWAAGVFLVFLQLRRLGRWLVGLVRSRVGTGGPSRGTVRIVAVAACAAAAGAALGAVAIPRALTTAPPVATPNTASGALPAGPPTLYGRVSEVIDAGTVRVDVDGRPVTVRVVGLDTAALPECARPDATAFARGELDGRTVTLVPDPTLPAAAPDPAAWPAYLVTEEQKSYTDSALTAGWAAAGEGRYRPGFLAEQEQARDAQAGMWGPCR